MSQPSRLSLAGRFFFNLAVAPLIFAGAMALVIWLVSAFNG